MGYGKVRELKQSGVIDGFCLEPFVTQLTFYSGYQLLLPTVVTEGFNMIRQECQVDL